MPNFVSLPQTVWKMGFEQHFWIQDGDWYNFSHGSNIWSCARSHSNRSSRFGV